MNDRYLETNKKYWTEWREDCGNGYDNTTILQEKGNVPSTRVVSVDIEKMVDSRYFGGRQDLVKKLDLHSVS